MEILVQVDHLSKSYGNKVALKDVCLTIPTGKIIGLLGKNEAFDFLFAGKNVFRSFPIRAANLNLFSRFLPGF